MDEPAQQDASRPRPTPTSVPWATVRLQLHAGFGFAAATALVPYLAALGVSHVYTSPFLKARPGSTHGYDITDHNVFNPELGDEAAFESLVTTLHDHGMGLILDFVPNHMGIGGNDNPWWLDVLEWGRASPYAAFFDIDWSPAGSAIEGRLLLPFLGDHYGNVLERGELRLAFDAERGAFSVWYFEHRFPIALRDYPRILRGTRPRLDDAAAIDEVIDGITRLRGGGRSLQQQAVRRRQAEDLKARLAALAAARPDVAAGIASSVAAINGTPGDPASVRELHQLLERQAYRIAFWRVAVDEINYRRFFDINDLAGLRIEEPELFELSHRLVFRLLAEGKLQGLRIDHIDGLYDPEEYCRRLQDRAAYLLPAGETGGAAPRGHPLYLLVEKILARHEHLRESWPVDGTTGYDFMNLVNGLFVDPAAEAALSETYRRFTGVAVDFETLLVQAKRQILTENLASELSVLADRLYRLAQQSWTTRDYTLTAMRRALIHVIAHFPVYRTYITGTAIDDEDRRYIDWAIAQARKAANALDESIYDFLHAALGAELKRAPGRGYRRRDVVATAMKVQQLTGPTMAKAAEDTAFYRYHRLVSLNEVGGDPARFGVSPAAFHHLNQERLRRHPHAMLATATHDHKRGEDTRLRIDAISELPQLWSRAVRRWARLNRSRKREIDGTPAPHPNDEYLLYQTLIGAWPADIDDPADPALADFADRIVGFMTKALREGKERSTWGAPAADYEAAVESFIRGILDPARGRAFLAGFLELQRRIAVIGTVNGLAQALLKLTAPGVPDLYQGSEYWDLSLVDPDNRRPVDFAARSRSLAAGRDAAPAALLAAWRDGRIKQHVVARALEVRGRLPQLFAEGDYLALEPLGGQAERLLAFRRRLGEAEIVVVTPRLVAPLIGDAETPLPPASAWGDTAVALPEAGRYRDCMTGAETTAGDGTLAIAALLERLPVALLSRLP